MIAPLIASLVALAIPQATPADAATGVGAIGRQQLPSKGCAAFLWSTADRTLIAMAEADPALLRMSLDGRSLDLPRTAQDGITTLGLSARTTYAVEDATATLEMEVNPRDDLTAGAQVSAGSLRIDRAGRDTIVVPVAGMVGCAA